MKRTKESKSTKDIVKSQDAQDKSNSVENAAISLADLLDFEQLSQILENFCNAVGIASAIIDLKGNVVIPFQFEEYHPFEYEVTAVKYKGKFGLIRKDGTWAVPARFEELNIGFCPCFR